MGPESWLYVITIAQQNLSVIVLMFKKKSKSTNANDIQPIVQWWVSHKKSAQISAHSVAGHEL